MQVETSIDEAEVGRIRVGQTATFTVDSFPGRAFSGKVSQVRKAAQVVQNVVTYTAVITTENPDLNLFPGMTANVRIVVDTRENALRVPNSALRFRPAGTAETREAGGARDRAAAPAREGETKKGGRGQQAGRRSVAGGRVWVLDDAGQPRAVNVRIGLTDGTYSEVAGGELQDGASVIVGTLDDSKARSQAKSGGPRFGF